MVTFGFLTSSSVCLLRILLRTLVYKGYFVWNPEYPALSREPYWPLWRQIHHRDVAALRTFSSGNNFLRSHMVPNWQLSLMGWDDNCFLKPQTMINGVPTGPGLHFASYPEGEESGFPIVQIRIMERVWSTWLACLGQTPISQPGPRTERARCGEWVGEPKPCNNHNNTSPVSPLTVRSRPSNKRESGGLLSPQWGAELSRPRPGLCRSALALHGTFWEYRKL